MTGDELAAIRERNELAREAAPLGEMYLLSRAVEDTDALLADVERLRAENAALREIVAKIDRDAWYEVPGADPDTIWCRGCGVELHPFGASHREECPVTLARALLGKDA